MMHFDERDLRDVLGVIVIIGKPLGYRKNPAAERVVANHNRYLLCRPHESLAPLSRV